MFPNGRYGHDENNMEKRPQSALRIAMQLAADLREVGEIARPGEANRQSGETVEDNGGGDGQRNDHEHHRCMDLGVGE